MKSGRFRDRHGEMRSVCKILAKKPDGKSAVGRLRHEWMGSVEILACLTETGCEDVNWFYLAQDGVQCWLL
jgi:hypothetical protein